MKATPALCLAYRCWSCRLSGTPLTARRLASACVPDCLLFQLFPCLSHRTSPRLEPSLAQIFKQGLD